MKKSIIFTVCAIMAVCSFTSCKKTCTCTEKYTGVSQEIDTDTDYQTCGEIEDLFHTLSAGLGQSWSCK